MGKGEMTVAQAGRRGGTARAQRHSEDELAMWGKLGGRPRKLGASGLARLMELINAGETQPECAKALGVSVPTIARALARLRTR